MNLTTSRMNAQNDLHITSYSIIMAETGRLNPGIFSFNPTSVSSACPTPVSM